MSGRPIAARKGGQARHSFIERAIGVLALREEIIREIVNDATANQQALRALTIGSLGPAVGSMYLLGVLALPFYFVVMLVLWSVTGVAVYFLATRLFESAATVRNPMLFARGVAFAGLPRLILVAGFHEIVFGVLAVVALLWSVAAMVLSIRISLNLSVTRALGSVLVGLAAVAVVSSIAVQIVLAIA